MLEPKTRIGSPYVIEGMEKARKKGKQTVCGWEANGGFLTGSEIKLAGNNLAALPTRDAVLPILCALFASNEKSQTLIELFEQLPKRFSRALLIKQFPRSRSLEVVRFFSPADERIKEISFDNDRIVLIDENGEKRPASAPEFQEMDSIRCGLERMFSAEMGLTGIARLNYVDGVRVIFSSGEVAHVRPSGNADELRIYTVADTQIRADAIAKAGVAEPDGILRKMEDAIIHKEQK
jgi:phosphomannomutase